MLLLGASSELLHPGRFPDDRILQTGDIITNEISPKFAGYWAQPSIPVCVEKPTDLFQRLTHVCLEAFQEGLDALRPGITNRQLAEAMNKPIRAAGFTWIRPQFNGIGLEISEGPRDRFHPRGRGANVEEVIREDMVLVFQPMAATEDLSSGVQLGDTILVKKSGAERLGNFELKLHVI